MNYMGDYAVGQIVYIWFNTFSSNDPSASVTMTDFVTGDAHVHKDDSLTQRASTTGQTIDIDIDGVAGVHWIKIDTADNTTADFYEAGHDYFVRIEGVTIDGGTVNAVVGCFSIANRRTAGQMAVTSIEGLTDQNTFTLTSGEASGDDDAYNDCLCIITDQVTKIQKAIGYISDYTGSTRSVQLYASPLCTGFIMAVGDSVEIFSSSAFTNVHTVNRTAQTAGDLAAAVITNAQGADVATDVAAMIDGNNRVDVGSWLGNAVTHGTGGPDVNINAVSDDTTAAATLELAVEKLDQSTGQIDAGTFAAGAIDAAAIAANAIGASELAADAATEIADALLTRQMTEAYAADGTAPTLAQAIFLIMQQAGEFAIASTTITVKKLDGSTSAATFTLDDATNPTSRTRAT